MSALKADDLAKLFKKPGEKRYDYFVKKVADTEEVFVMGDGEDGWAQLGDDDDTDIIPVFPHAEACEAFRKAAGFDEFQVEILDVNELIEWLDGMVEDNMLVAVFPNLEFVGAVVDPMMLKEDLQKELEKYDEDGKRINK